MAQVQRATDEATLQEWHRRRLAGESWTTIAADYGLDDGVARKRYGRWVDDLENDGDEPEQPQGNLIFPDLKVRTDEEDFCRRYLEVVIEQQELERGQNNEQDVAHVRIPETKPIGLVFSGDWHIGNRGTDHKAVQDHLDVIRETDGMYLVGMGDFADWFIGSKTRVAIKEQQFKPAQQRTIARDLLLRRTGGKKKVVTLLAGNHCWWPEELTGEDPVADIAAEAEVPYLGYGGTIFLSIGDMEYKIAVWHSYPGGSAINPGNNNRRLRADYEGLDVNCLGHYHFNYAQDGTTKEGRNFVDLRSGSFKLRDDRYAAQKVGSKSGDPRMPMCILFPTERKAWHIRDFREWLPMLRWLREGNA